jgi:hypothetical protein
MFRKYIIDTVKLRFFYCGFVCFLLFVSIPNIKLFAQKVELSGFVKSAVDSTTIPFCSIAVHNDAGNLITGTQSDFNGRFYFTIDSSLLSSATILFKNHCFYPLEFTMAQLHLLHLTDSIVLLRPECQSQGVKYCPYAATNCDIISIYYYFRWERPSRFARREKRKGKLLLRMVDGETKTCCPATKFCKVHNVEF